MKVNIKKLNKDAKIPAYGSEFAAGADLYACLDGEVKIPAGETVVIPTGIALELPAAALPQSRGLHPQTRWAL